MSHLDATNHNSQLSYARMCFADINRRTARAAFDLGPTRLTCKLHASRGHSLKHLAATRAARDVFGHA